MKPINIFVYHIAFLLCILTPQSSWAQNTTTPAHPISIEQMVGQMIMVGFRGLDSTSHGNMPNLLDSITAGQVGGVILFNYDVVLKSPVRNVRSVEQVGKLTNLLQSKAPIPLFIAIDQEGGYVRRLRPEHGTFDLPSAESMGQKNPDETLYWGEKTGKLLNSIGININFAPSVDVNINPQSPAIGKNKRSFSANADTVAMHAQAFTKGLAKHNIIAAYKHFPGHGSSLTDTHVGMTDITKTWDKTELIPYMAHNRPQVPLIIMTGHLFLRQIDPNYPATLSSTLITKLLRQELQWDGVIASDDMQMHALSLHYSRKEAIRLAILAGVDMLVAGNNLDYDENIGQNMHADIMALIAEGKISTQRIRESYTRIMQLKQKIGLVHAGSW